MTSGTAPPLTVLVVEDDEVDWRATSRQLSKMAGIDCRPIRASSFDDGLAAFRDGPPDICLLDQNLGGKTGIEFLDAVGAKDLSVPIILLTGAGNRETDLEAMTKGAAEYLTKERLDADLLERAIRYSLERKRSEAALRAAQDGLEARVRERTRELEAEVEKRQRSEIELEHLSGLQAAILNALPVHIAVVDQEGVITSVNEAWEAFGRDGGLSPEKCGVGSNFLDACRSASDTAGDVAAGQDVAEIASGLRDVLSGQLDSFVTQYPCLSDSEERWFHFVATPLRTRRHQGAVLMHIDITGQKVAEREIRRAAEAAILADRAKSDFLANMSHELRTPLNAIIGFSDAMAGGFLGEDCVTSCGSYIKDINQSGRHLLAIINDILDLSKIEAGNMDLDVEAVPVGPLIESVMRFVRMKAESKGVEIVVEISSPQPAVLGDELRLKQALVNLLSNAVKFTERGGRVRMAVREDGGMIDLSVADTGIGMTEEEVAVALQPFRQIDGALNKRFEGTGLGLPLARRFVQAMGGSFVLDSAPGQGTAVTLTLPRGPD